MANLGRLYNWHISIRSWKDCKIINGVAKKMDIKNLKKSREETGGLIVFLMLSVWQKRELEIGIYQLMPSNYVKYAVKKW